MCLETKLSYITISFEIRNMKIPKIPKYILTLSIIGTGTGLYIYLKDSQGGPKYIKNVSMSGKTIIITGANSGLGKATTLDLAKRGGRIVMACRNLDKCEAVKNEIIDTTCNTNLECRRLDLASLQSIRDFAKITNEKEKRIDVLINNAGVMEVEKKWTADGFEKQLGVNFLGHFLLTNLLLDKIVASGPSRIINLACTGYNNAVLNFNDLNSDTNFNSNNAYKLSKMAMTLFTSDLAKRLEGKKVTVNAVNPGLSDTNIRQNFPQNTSSISYYIMRPFLYTIFINPTRAAHTIIYAAVDPTINDVTGQIFMECDEYPIDPSILKETNIKRLWLTAEKWTRLT